MITSRGYVVNSDSNLQKKKKKNTVPRATFLKKRMSCRHEKENQNKIEKSDGITDSLFT